MQSDEQQFDNEAVVLNLDEWNRPTNNPHGARRVLGRGGMRMPDMRGNRSEVQAETEDEPSWEQAVADELGAIYPTEFYVRATDGDKNSTEVRAYIPSNLHRMIKHLSSKDAYPVYGSIQDVVRDAIIHRVAYLIQSNLPTPSWFLEEQRAMKLRERAAIALAIKNSQEQARKDIDEALSELAHCGDTKGHDALLADSWKVLHDMSSPYREALETLLLKHDPNRIHQPPPSEPIE